MRSITSSRQAEGAEMSDRQRLIKEVREHLGKLPHGAGSIDTEAVANELAKRYSITFEEIRAIVIIEAHAAGLTRF
jgi:hypothetical protein